MLYNTFMNIDRKQFIINVLYFACWALIIYVGFQYLLPIFLPFLFAYFLSVLSHRITKDQSTLILLVIYIVVGFLLALIIIALISNLQDFITRIPSIYRETLEPYFSNLYSQLEDLVESLDIEVLRQSLETVLALVKDAVSTLVNKIVSLLSSAVVSIPNAMFSVIIFIVASFYFTADYDKVQGFISRNMSTLHEYGREKLGVIVVAYAKIMSLTFIEVTIGLLILGIPNALLLGVITAIVDILPVLGTGTVLIPWGIIELVVGNWKGIGILVLYVVITIIRQYVEPKIVGKELDIPPLLSLMSMVLGLRLFGLKGMIGLPLIISFYLYKRNSDIIKNA